MTRRVFKTHTLLTLLLLIAAITGACGSPTAAPAAPAQSGAATTALELPVTIDAATAEQIRQRDDVIILDVREDWEFASGHVPDATWIPLGQLASRLDEVPRDKTVVAVCRSGNRSSQATQLLRQQGFDAHNMQGGMISWEQAGFAVEK